MLKGLNLNVDINYVLEELKNTGKPTDHRLDMVRCWGNYLSKLARSIVTFIKAVPDFKQLHMDDQSSIIKGRQTFHVIQYNMAIFTLKIYKRYKL